MTISIASLITKAASKQTYYTIRFLADRDRIDDAYRAYGYFRWVDDTLDAESGSALERMAFLERQKSLLEKCYRGQTPRDANIQEQMLVELVQHDREKNSGLQLYLRNMMQVMDFDARRRGRLISQVELSEYTRWLATAVMECIHFSLGMMISHLMMKPVIWQFRPLISRTCCGICLRMRRLGITTFRAKYWRQVTSARRMCRATHTGPG